MGDPRLLQTWQAREQAMTQAKFEAMAGPEDPPQPTVPPPAPVREVPPQAVDSWVNDWALSTTADVADILIRGGTLGIVQPQWLGEFGRAIEQFKTPDERKSYLRKAAEVGGELIAGLPLWNWALAGKVGAAAIKMLPKGAGVVAQRATGATAEMAALGATQQTAAEVVPAVKNQEMPEGGVAGAAGRIAAHTALSAAFGTVVGAGAGKLESIISRRAAKRVETELKTRTVKTAAVETEEAAARMAEEEAGIGQYTDDLIQWAKSGGSTKEIHPNAEATSLERSVAPVVPEAPAKLAPTPERIAAQFTTMVETRNVTALEAFEAANKVQATVDAMRADLKPQKLWEPLQASATHLREEAKYLAALEFAEQAGKDMEKGAGRGPSPLAQQVAEELASRAGRLIEPAGRADVAVLSVMARAAAGALTGSVIGETPEERVKNALALAGGAAILSPALFRRATAAMAARLPAVEKSIAETVTVPMGRKLVTMKRLTPDEIKAMAAADPSLVEIPNNRSLSIKWDAVQDSDGVQAMLKRVYSVIGEEGSTARHMTDEQLWRAAKDVGVADLLARKAGDPINREQLAGAMAVFKSLEGELSAIVDLAASGADLTPQMVTRLSQGTAIASVIQGGLNEGGAVLRLGRVMAESAGAKQLDSLSKIAEAFGGPNAITLEGGIPPSALSEMVRDAVRQGKTASFLSNLHKDLIGSWLNMLLSSGVTFMRNAFGTGVMLPMAIAERGVASVGGNVSLRESQQMVYGIVEALRDGVRIGVNSLARRPGLAATRAGIGAAVGATTGDSWEERTANAVGMAGIGLVASAKLPEWGVTKLEGAGRKVLDPANYGVDLGSYFGRGMSLLGDLIQTPGDALRTADNLFKMMNVRAELRALTIRALDQDASLTTPAAYDEAFRRALENPSKEVFAAAKAFAEKNTFTRRLGEWGELASRVADATIITKMVIPFMRTTVNITKEFAERYPILAQLNTAHWQAINKGGAERDLALAKQALGLTLALPAFYLAEKGFLQGDMPKHQGTASLAQQDGRQRYAWVFPGKGSVSFDSMAPMGMFFGMAADITELMRHADDTTRPLVLDFMGSFILASAANITSQTWIQGISNATQAALDEDGDKLQRYMQMQARSLVPNIAARWAQGLDPVRHEIHSLKDSVFSRVPGLSQDVYPYRDALGDIIYRYGTVGPSAWSPFTWSPEGTDPVRKAILSNGITVSKPSRTLFGVGESNKLFPTQDQTDYGIPLTDEQYDRFEVLAGNAAKSSFSGKGAYDRLLEYVTSSKYAQDSKAGREKEILGIINEHRTKAKEVLMKEYPNIKAQLIDLGRARKAALKPTGGNLIDSLGR